MTKNNINHLNDLLFEQIDALRPIEDKTNANAPLQPVDKGIVEGAKAAAKVASQVLQGAKLQLDYARKMDVQPNTQFFNAKQLES